MKFDSYHPAINFLFFASVLIFSFAFTQPVFLLLSYLCAFIYSSYLGKGRAFAMNLVLGGLAGIYAVYYASFNHFGVTSLANNWIGNDITLESIYYGMVQGIHLATGAMWFYCTMKIISSDKVIYLLGRIWPRLSLFVSILLRFVPRVVDKFRSINVAQTAIGRGIGQGHICAKIGNVFRMLSIIITWCLENFVESGLSMKSRGYTLRGRTAFSIYRFDNRDRMVVIVMFTCLTIIGMGMMLDQTKMQINPYLSMNPVTILSYVFYANYIFFCLLPMILQMVGQVRWKRLGITER